MFWIVIGGVVLLAIVIAALPLRARVTPDEVAQVIENFLSGEGGGWDWGEFLCVRIKDPEMDAIRERLAGLDEEFPPEEVGHYCSEDGLLILKSILKELRERES